MKTSNDGCLTIHDTESGAEFLDCLRPSGPVSHEAESYDSWIFRGIGWDKYELIPSALRRDDQKYMRELTDDPQPDKLPDQNFHQLEAELRILSKIFRHADAVGLSIPDDTRKVRSILQHETTEFQTLFNLRKGPVDWLLDEYLALAGLAQHYGLPTRLLDWTRNSRAALYFAAESAVRFRNRYESSKESTVDDQKRSDGRMAVWAMNLESILSFRFREPQFLNFHYVTSPAATNPNLNAQEGVFTTWKIQIRHDSLSKPQNAS